MQNFMDKLYDEGEDPVKDNGIISHTMGKVDAVSVDWGGIDENDPGLQNVFDNLKFTDEMVIIG